MPITDVPPVLIRRERADDVPAIRAVTAAAFTGLPHSLPPLEDDLVPGEATLVGWLRDDPGWIPELSLVAVVDDEVVGHVVATRGYVDEAAALGIGPVSVLPARQRQGVGSALMRSVIGAADALGEPLVALLGDPGYYSRFGFTPAARLEIKAPDEAWGDYFQALPLSAYSPSLHGTFRYAAPFGRLG